MPTDDPKKKAPKERIPKPAILKIPISYDRWKALDTLEANEAVDAVKKFGIDEIRMRHRYEESELEEVASDDTYQRTCRSSYLNALDHARHPGMFARGHTIPKHLKVQYMKPGTRDERNRPMENT